jgi:hypothetical protein
MNLLFPILGNIIVSFLYDDSKKKQAEEYVLRLAMYTGKPILNAGCKLRKLECAINCDINPYADWVQYCNVEDLSQFNDKQFSVVYLSHVLEHVNNPVAALSEAERVGEYVVIVLPKPWQITNLLHPDHKWDIDDSYDSVYFISRKDRKVFIYRKPNNLTREEEIQMIESVLDNLCTIYSVHKPMYVLDGWCPSGAIACFIDTGEMVFYHERVYPNVVAHEFAHYLQYLRGDFKTKSKEELEDEAIKFEQMFLRGDLNARTANFT